MNRAQYIVQKYICQFEQKKHMPNIMIQ